MNNSKLIKILGMVATIGGVAATLLTDWVNEKKMDEKIDEAINAKNFHNLLFHKILLPYY